MGEPTSAATTIALIARTVVASPPGSIDLDALEHRVDWDNASDADVEMWHFLIDVEGHRAEVSDVTSAGELTDRIREELASYAA